MSKTRNICNKLCIAIIHKLYCYFCVLLLLKINQTLPKIMDIINILIHCKFVYHVEFGFICEY